MFEQISLMYIAINSPKWSL